MKLYHKQRIYRSACWLLLILPLLLYMADAPVLSSGHAGWQQTDWFKTAMLLSQWTALSGITALSISFVLSSRYSPMEKLLGGLDKIYRLHHRMGIAAFVLLAAHPLFFSLRRLPTRFERIWEVWLPMHQDPAVNIGVISFWLFLILILVTLLRRVPYNIWKQSHRLMGLVLIGGVWHMLTLTETPGKSVAHWSNPTLHYYLIAVSMAGMWGFIYKEIWLRFYRQHKYRVTGIDYLTDQIMQIRLSPAGKPLEFEAGQFVFVRFFQSGLSSEQHPYTLCSPPGMQNPAITVKVLGDYTSRLYEQLQKGSEVYLEGPYGQFNYRRYSKRQIWLAAGIGVTPFVCWLHELELQGATDYRIDFYYCAHDRSQLVYKNELETWADRLEGVKLRFVCTENEGRLTDDQVQWEQGENPEIFICGPRDFVQTLASRFRQRGVADRSIHHEEFEFR